MAYGLKACSCHPLKNTVSVYDKPIIPHRLDRFQRHMALILFCQRTSPAITRMFVGLTWVL